MSVPYQQVFSSKASPFMRWCLSPFLLLFAAVFSIPLRESMDVGDPIPIIIVSLLIILCIAGFLALWGVPFVGRLAAGIIAFACGWYVVDQCIVNFSGDWGFGGRRSQASPINSILGFIVFGLPCLVYCIFGRFTVRKEPEHQDDFDEFYYNDLDRDEPQQINKANKIR